ncbi:hypothetical protein HPB47_002763 [Ixodes persulcatus]|uniref:Uncharacterized protein n=1 Tax=Ixodes persulcatus TaxID=34615 RepID=A0AC60PLT6_IXOPE|nr:hypothetical protein HPB47_002763 [Ixodes persulcatus]
MTPAEVKPGETSGLEDKSPMMVQKPKDANWTERTDDLAPTALLVTLEGIPTATATSTSGFTRVFRFGWLEPIYVASRSSYLHASDAAFADTYIKKTLRLPWLTLTIADGLHRAEGDGGGARSAGALFRRIARVPIEACLPKCRCLMLPFHGATSLLIQRRSPAPPAVYALLAMEPHHGAASGEHPKNVHRSRCDLLLAQYASDDRTNLRKSGTEEEYSEREHLLQELVDLARESGYKFRAPRKGNGAAATPARERSMTPAAARSSAAAARDSAADVLVAPGNTADFSGACSGEQATAEELFTLILSPEDAASPAVPSGGSGEGTDQPDTARAEICQGNSAAASPCPTARNEPMREARWRFDKMLDGGIVKFSSESSLVVLSLLVTAGAAWLGYLAD